MTWLGLDIGAKRTGVAISTSGVLSTPLGLVSGAIDQQLRELKILVSNYSIDQIVVGSSRAAHHADYLQALKTTWQGQNPKIIFVDETLSTKIAEQHLAKRGDSIQESDALSAQILLEQYFIEINTKGDSNAIK